MQQQPKGRRLPCQHGSSQSPENLRRMQYLRISDSGPHHAPAPAAAPYPSPAACALAPAPLPAHALPPGTAQPHSLSHVATQSLCAQDPGQQWCSRAFHSLHSACGQTTMGHPQQVLHQGRQKGDHSGCCIVLLTEIPRGQRWSVLEGQ